MQACAGADACADWHNRQMDMGHVIDYSVPEKNILSVLWPRYVSQFFFIYHVKYDFPFLGDTHQTGSGSGARYRFSQVRRCKHSIDRGMAPASAAM